jgi:hypothetical protein
MHAILSQDNCGKSLRTSAMGIGPVCIACGLNAHMANRHAHGRALRTQSRAQVRPVIGPGTLAGLHAHQHELHAYCLRCDRWLVLPLERTVAEGRGSLRLPITVRCRDRGDPRQLQVRPPTPSRPRAAGGVQPATR